LTKNSLHRTLSWLTLFGWILITMANETDNASSIYCSTNYLQNLDINKQKDNNNPRKTSKWHSRLFNRTDNRSFSNSYHQFDQLLDSDYPFVFMDNHYTSTIDSSQFSASNWSLASTTSQSSNDSTSSNEQRAKHQKKTLTHKMRTWRHQKKAKVEVASQFQKYVVQ
jgi:hypothetical protein